MWFRWWRNYPERYKAMHRGGAYVFTLLGAATGIVFWIVSGFRSWEALLLAVVSVVLFFLVGYLTKNTILPEEALENQDEFEQEKEAHE